MTKIILLLMFSLGLVSAANIDTLCGEERYLKSQAEDYIRSLSRSYAIGKDYDKTKKMADKIYNALLSSMFSHHSKEFKIDDKNSICVYINIIDMSFENTQLTQEEIGKFERYMAEQGRYSTYEQYKKSYLRALKFFKYYRNHIPSIYEFKEVDGYMSYRDYIGYLKEHNGKMMQYDYIYGTQQKGYLPPIYSVDILKEEVVKRTACSEATVNSKEELAECENNKKVLPLILKWAESKLKGAKNE